MIEGHLEEKERELHGYSLHEEQFLICPSCKTSLASIVVIEKDTKLFISGRPIELATFRAECPKCKTMSFEKSFKDVKLCYGPISPFIINDVCMDYQDNKAKITIRLSK